MTSMVPDTICFQLKDATHGLTHFARSSEFLFADDPAPLGDGSERPTVVVDMSEDGSQPVAVRSLSSSLMVTGFGWEPPARPGRAAAVLTVNGLSLQRDDVADRGSATTLRTRHFADIQRDTRRLSERVALLKQALANLETSAETGSTAASAAAAP